MANPRLLIALAGGLALAFLFWRLNIPLPWLLGPLFVAVGISLVTGDLDCPIWLRWAGQFTISTAVAMNLSGEVVDQLARNLPWMMLSAVLIILVAILGARALVRFGRLDRATAAFSLLPGGAVEMATLAQQYGGNGTFVAITQTLRITTIVVTIPFVLLALGYHVRPVESADQIVELPSLAIVIAVGAAMTLLFFRFKLANPAFIGPLVGAGIYALLGFPRSAVPEPALIIAQLMLGVSLGAMFDSTSLRKLRPLAGIATGISAILVVSGVVLGILFTWIGAGSIGTMLAANAPGSIAEMAILAKSTGLEPALVVAYHLTRIFIIVPFAALLYRLV